MTEDATSKIDRPDEHWTEAVRHGQLTVSLYSGDPAKDGVLAKVIEYNDSTVASSTKYREGFPDCDGVITWMNDEPC